MKNVQKIDLGLTGYDELFMNDAERKENKLPRIYDVPISEIDDFPDHPFKVKVDEDMTEQISESFFRMQSKISMRRSPNMKSTILKQRTKTFLSPLTLMFAISVSRLWTVRFITVKTAV